MQISKYVLTGVILALYTSLGTAMFSPKQVSVQGGISKKTVAAVGFIAGAAAMHLYTTKKGQLREQANTALATAKEQVNATITAAKQKANGFYQNNKELIGSAMKVAITGAVGIASLYVLYNLASSETVTTTVNGNTKIVNSGSGTSVTTISLPFFTVQWSSVKK